MRNWSASCRAQDLSCRTGAAIGDFWLPALLLSVALIRSPRLGAAAAAQVARRCRGGLERTRGDGQRPPPRLILRAPVARRCRASRLPARRRSRCPRRSPPPRRRSRRPPRIRRSRPRRSQRSRTASPAPRNRQPNRQAGRGESRGRQEGAGRQAPAPETRTAAAPAFVPPAPPPTFNDQPPVRSTATPATDHGVPGSRC